MADYPAARIPDRCPTHPGDLLADIIPATGRSTSEIARRMGISRQHLHDIITQKKPVSPAVAVRLGKLLGNGAEPWILMQAAHDVWHAQRDIDVSGIETLRPA